MALGGRKGRRAAAGRGWGGVRRAAAGVRRGRSGCEGWGCPPFLGGVHISILVGAAGAHAPSRPVP